MSHDWPHLCMHACLAWVIHPRRLSACVYMYPIPLHTAALVADTILCMHGGLSPDLQSLDQVLHGPPNLGNTWIDVTFLSLFYAAGS